MLVGWMTRLGGRERRRERGGGRGRRSGTEWDMGVAK